MADFMVSGITEKPTTRAENSTYVIETLRRLGFELHPDSRLMRMHQVLQQGYHEFGTPEYWISLESDRDMVQIGFALHQLEADRDNPAFLNVIKRLLDDSVLAKDDRTESKGRNAQFELYLAAVCQKAKLLPVGYDEPDVTCFVEGTQFCIAAKRIKKIGQVRKRMKKAAKQIVDRKCKGIIALDISIGFNRKNYPVLSQSQNQTLDWINDFQAKQLFDAHEDSIERHGGGKGVLAVVAFDFRTRLVDGAYRQHRSAHWLELQNSGEENRLYETFYDRFIAVVPNIE